MPINPVLQYHDGHSGQAIVVMKHGAIVDERYSNFFGQNTAKDTESTSKTLGGLMAVLAVSEGLIPSLDVKLSTVLTQLIGTDKEHVTLRSLLNLTSGWSGGTVGDRVTYEQAIALPFVAANVGRFGYGPGPIHVAAAFFNKLAQAAGFATWVEWLNARLLVPAGVTIKSWAPVAPGQPHLAGGARMTCRNLANLGEMLRRDPILTAQLAMPGPYSPYGLTLWRMVSDNLNALIGGNMTGAVPIPGDGVAAAGANNQRLYLFRAIGVVVARFGNASSTWSDKVFGGRVVDRYG